MVTTYIRQGLDIKNLDLVHCYVTDNIDRFIVGIDSSDGNKYKINRKSSLSDLSDFEIDSNGNVKIQHNLITEGDLRVNGNFIVDGITTFMNSEITTIEDTCIQLAIADSTLIIGIIVNVDNIGTVTTESPHNKSKGDFILIQGVDVSDGKLGYLDKNINKVHKILNITSSFSFEISLPNGTYTATGTSSLGKIGTVESIDGGGISIEAHDNGVHSNKSLTFNSRHNSWESNINFNISNEDNVFSINGIPKLSNTSVGTFDSNFDNVYTNTITSSTKLILNGNDCVKINAIDDIEIESENININSDSIISLKTDGSISEKISIINTQGSAQDAIYIVSLNGGISIQASEDKDIVFNDENLKNNVRIATTNSTNTLFVNSNNDNVGIGNSAHDRAYKLNVSGNILVTDIVTISDERYKTFTKPIADHYDLDKLFDIDGLRGIIFQWKDIEGKNFDTEKYNIGVFAQEVEKLVPELVTTDKDGYKAVNYEKFAGLFIEKFKQIQTRYENLETRFYDLETKLNNI